MVDICGNELPTNLQNFTQKDLTEMKIFLKVLGGGATFLKHPVNISIAINHRPIKCSMHAADAQWLPAFGSASQFEHTTREQCKFGKLEPVATCGDDVAPVVGNASC